MCDEIISAKITKGNNTKTQVPSLRTRATFGNSYHDLQSFTTREYLPANQLEKETN